MLALEKNRLNISSLNISYKYAGKQYAYIFHFNLVLNTHSCILEN